MRRWKPSTSSLRHRLCPNLPQWQRRRPHPPPQDVSFFTDVRFPDRVKRGEVQWLTVQLTLEAIEESMVAATVPVRFEATSPNELPPPEFVEVRLVAPGFSEVTGVWERTMTVYPQRDSQPVVFLLQSDKLGAKRLSIDFVHKGRMIASIAFKSEVVEGSAARTDQPVELEEKPEVAPLAENPPPPADLLLRVVRTAEANGLAFMLSSSLPQLPLRSQPVGDLKLTEKDPQAFFTNRLQRLSDLAAAIPDSTTDGRMVKEIESLGEGLFELLMPPPLQKIYWEQIKPLIDKGELKTMLIISDEPWIPWELIKPYFWNDASNTEEKADFLVEQVALSRWLARPLPPPLEVTAAALVAPDVNLTSVQAETTFFTELSSQHHVTLQGPLDERDKVIDSLRDGEFQILHFATHGSFDAANADQSELTLADGSLTPADLMGGDLRGIRMRRPLVFLNACHSGQVALSLTGLGGWADKFFREARASAFVGTLWEVSDELAAEFAASFYTALAGGQDAGRSPAGGAAANPRKGKGQPNLAGLFPVRRSERESEVRLGRFVAEALDFCASGGQNCSYWSTQISSQERKPSAITVLATLSLVTATGSSRIEGISRTPLLITVLFLRVVTSSQLSNVRAAMTAVEASLWIDL